jgi:hypothetical protein
MTQVLEYRHKYKPQKIRIVYDQDPSSPRDWDNLGVIYAQHPRYNLSDKTASEAELEEAKKTGVVFNLYMYEHSGVALSISNTVYPYTDRWDSGQVGYVYITRETIQKEYNQKKITKKLYERIQKGIEGEIDAYNRYLNGWVYGFQQSKVHKCNFGGEHEEVIDSCYGFYCDADQVISEVIGKDEAKKWVEI